MSARDDWRPASTDGMVAPPLWELMCDEIDRLRLALAWTEQIAQDRGEENERLRQQYVYPQ